MSELITKCRHRAAKTAKKLTFSAKSDIFSPKCTDVWRVTDLGFTPKKKLIDIIQNSELENI